MEHWERWLATAQDSLQSAHDLDAGNPRSAISRYYYVAYQSITAVLLFLQQTPPEEAKRGRTLTHPILSSRHLLP